MGKVLIGKVRPTSTQVLCGLVEINCVPVNDRGCDEAEPRSPKALILEGPVADFTLPMKDYGASKVVAGFSLVKTGMTALTKGRVRQPLQCEQ